jgi:hypothetical protein
MAQRSVLACHPTPAFPIDKDDAASKALIAVPHSEGINAVR